MSFGRPPSFQSFVTTPPDRGSFPLDHEGECKQMMKAYLTCLTSNKNDNTPCRPQSKAYLSCRMANGLMEKDNWENLGLADVPDTPSSAEGSVPEAAHSSPSRTARTD